MEYREDETSKACQQNNKIDITEFANGIYKIGDRGKP
jgi:hypothetical protein